MKMTIDFKTVLIWLGVFLVFNLTARFIVHYWEWDCLFVMGWIGRSIYETFTK